MGVYSVAGIHLQLAGIYFLFPPDYQYRAVESRIVPFLLPPFGILWSGWERVLKERLNQGFAIGAGLICVAVWLVVSPARVIVIQKL